MRKKELKIAKENVSTLMQEKFGFDPEVFFKQNSAF